MKVIGLISGTSVDGIDAALVEIKGIDLDLEVQLVAGATYPYPKQLREQILAVAGGRAVSVEHLAALDDAIANQFAQAAMAIETSHSKAQLIGSHGQTVFHRPVDKEAKDTLAYSLQLGRGELISRLTGITTVTNFRAADIAAGGEGAPLVSKIDACLLSHPTKSRCIQNLGGIGNVTYLPARQEDNWQNSICGWDTGPGNSLIDLAVQQLTGGKQLYDQDGSWAAQGTPCQELVEQWLNQEFFGQAPPKSTGRELFGSTYLEQCWQEAQAYKLNSADWLATLTELSVAAIVHSYRTFLPRLPDEILLCGGGSRNLYLQQRLATHLDPMSVLTTTSIGMDVDFKEAIAFAILAYWRQHCHFPGNLPQVTGASKAMLLGEIHIS